MQIEKYQGFKAELAVAETFEEIKLLESKAAAIAEFGRKNKIGLDEQNQWGVFRTEIEVKKGEWLDKMFPHGGDRKSSSTDTNLINEGITPDESCNARLVHHEPEIKEQVIQSIIQSGKVVTPSAVSSGIRAHKRVAYIEQQKKDIQENNISELSGIFDIISIDPPWNYGRVYDPDNSRVANPYPEMTIDEIKAIELPCSDNSILFLWTTHKFLPYAFDILKIWGFEYKATLVWNKEKIGMGDWFRMQCEFCLFAIKGKPFWNNTTERDLITESRREHSRKPEAFFNMVNKICLGRKLEYFARAKRTGWEIYGNDTEKF
jgi:N6-adenosine-specific RNA methylase IME4